MVSFFTPLGASVGSVTGSRRNNLHLPTFLAGSPSHRLPSQQSSAFLLRAPAWLPTLLTAFLTLSSFLYCYMALTSSSPLRACSRKWRSIGARSSDGRPPDSGTRPPPYWQQWPAYHISMFFSRTA